MYIFTDLDGTLLNNAGVISDATYEFLKNHPTIVTVPCTGRGFAEIDPRLKEICSYIICSNGALIYSKEQQDFILKEVLDGQLLSVVESKLDGIAHVVSVIVPTAVLSHRNLLDYFLDRHNQNAYEDAKRYRTLFDDSNEMAKHLNDVIKFHLNFWTVDDKEHAKQRLMGGDYYLTSSDPLNLEITNPKASKRYGTQWLIRTLNISTKDIICFGDADNDRPLFEVGGTNVAMINGSDHLKSLADHITEYSNDDDGVIKYLQSLD